MAENSVPPRVSDEAEIRWLLERYYFSIDSKNLDMLRSCFSESLDAIYHFGEERQTEFKSFEQFAAYLQKGIAWGGVSIHALSSCVVTFDGPNAAQAGAFAIAHFGVGGKVLVRGLHYNDRLVREDGRWLIHHRRHTLIWQFDGQSAAGIAAPHAN